jgi:tetratricopeptide (TPR) repeat protein
MSHSYSAADLKRMFGVSAATLRALAQAGHINPARSGPRARYSFQDLLVLRMVSALSAAKIPFGKINIALKIIRSSLPGAGLNTLSSGAVTAAEEGGRSKGNVTVFEPRNTIKPFRGRAGELRAQDLFEQGVALEERDPEAARQAYMESLSADTHHVESRLNLGRLLHLSGEHAAAEDIYRAGLTENALLSFNLALLLEDLERESEAIIAYRDALAHDPGLADAHFNLSRLHEKAGRSQDAFRHLLTFHRLTRDHGVGGNKRSRAKSRA